MGFLEAGLIAKTYLMQVYLTDSLAIQKMCSTLHMPCSVLLHPKHASQYGPPSSEFSQ
jgi:hypothetical protein